MHRFFALPPPKFTHSIPRRPKKHMTVKNWMTFVAQDIVQQSSIWLRAWEDFKNNLSNEIMILGLHATDVSGVLGLRCPINIPRVCDDFRPTLIISLIDDVYNMWPRTEARAEGRDSKGRPSFEQLLVARRAEQLLGDLISSHSPMPAPRHILCAAGNTLDALANLIIFDGRHHIFRRFISHKCSPKNGGQR